MSDYAIDFDALDDGADDDAIFNTDPVDFEVPYVPEAQPAMDVQYAPTLSGEQVAAAALSLASTPQAQQWLAEANAATEQAEREAAAPAIHSYLDMLEAKYGVTVDRRAVIDDAESMTPAFAYEYGASVETAERALAIAVRKNAGRETYDDVIARHVARVRR